MSQFSRSFYVVNSILTAVDCGTLSPPVNGAVMLTGTTLNSMAEFTCNEGYTLSGGRTRECQSNAEWSGVSNPTCNSESTNSCMCRLALRYYSVS